ncbi:Probable protein phosphatase 2C 8 [Linum grandiflorum]
MATESEISNRTAESGSSNLQPTANHKRESSDYPTEDSSAAAKKQKLDIAAVSEEDDGKTKARVSEEQQCKKVLEIEAEAAEDKGSRHSMEDAWVVLLDAALDYPGKLRCAHFAIYDGHGGRLAAEYAKKHLHENVLSAGLPRELLDVRAAKKAILDGFRKTDESLLKESASGGWQDGSTAVCIWILGQTVFVANIGDAKAVLGRSTTNGLQNASEGTSQLKAIVLTREHKAIYPQERSRIQKAGGSVSSNGRLQGRLEVSRSFGDRNFKKVYCIRLVHFSHNP